MTFAIGVALTAVVGTVYAMCAARDIVFGDTPELITAAVTLGIPHPPGYPLFTMLGHLFGLLPVGSVPFRLDLMAVICGTATVVLVYSTALRLTDSVAASTCAAVVLAFTPVFWSWSLVAEVFSLNNLLAAVLVYLLVIWEERPGNMAVLVFAAFVMGLGLANQQTIVLLGPAVLILLWRRRRQLLERPRVLALTIGAFVSGLLPYAYLLWAAASHPRWNWGDPSSLERLFAVMTRKHFGTGQLVGHSGFSGGSPGDRLMALVTSFGILACVLIVLGIVEAYRSRRCYLWFTLLAFCFAGPLFVAYANIDISEPVVRFVLERFFLLSHVVLAPLAAFGVLLGAKLLASVVPAVKRAATALVALTVVAAVIGGIVANYRRIDQSNNHIARRFAEDILATLEPNSVALAGGDEIIAPLAYLHYVEGYRPDITLIVQPFLYTDWYVQQLRRECPNLVVSFTQLGTPSGTLRVLVDANPGVRFGLLASAADDSLKGSYWLYQRGLVWVVEPNGKSIQLGEMLAENEKLFSRYRPPSPTEVNPNNFERTLPTHYAVPAMEVAQQCERAHYYPGARIWYERARALQPDLPQVREALTRIPEQP